MPDRCSDPTCEQHWPPVDDPGHTTCEHPSHTGIYHDLIRAKAKMETAPPNWSAPDE